MDTNKMKNVTNKMNSNEAFKITGNWDTQTKQLKAKFTELNDSDLKFETGKENEMLGRLGKKLDKKRDEVINIIKKNQAAKV